MHTAAPLHKNNVSKNQKYLPVISFLCKKDVKTANSKLVGVFLVHLK